MNREEAEALANELLSHYSKQSWREHFSQLVPVHNPANYLLVKDTQQFIAMLHRRGYSLIAEQEAGVYDKMYSVQCANEVHHFAFDAILFEMVASVSERLDQWIGAGQHHMRHDCGYPLLRETKNAGERETLAYRAASAGPSSKPLLECPQCQRYVQNDSVREIDDGE